MYKNKHKILYLIFCISFFTIKFRPHDTRVVKTKNEVKPKLCNKKSAVIPPYKPNRLFILLLPCQYKKVGSLGEYEKKDKASKSAAKIKLSPINSMVRFFKKSAKFL